MEKLPNEILLNIFNQLRMKDLIQCRLVCKRFLLLCREVKVTEVIISNMVVDMREYWFRSNKEINHKDAIDVRTFTAHRSTFRLDQFLKRLHFKGSYDDYNQLNLNDLIKLEQLKIDMNISNTDNNSEIVRINLPNLKILEVGEQHMVNDRREFNIATPKLEKLKCIEFETINLDDPNTVNHLEVVYFNESAETLKNVQHLKTSYGLLPIQDIFSVYRKLTTIECNDDGIGRGDVHAMNSLRYMVEQKRTRPELKIYFQSVELIRINQIEEYGSKESILAFQMKNYGSLHGNIVYNRPFDYNQLMRLVNGILPQDFYQKYFNISSVIVLGKVKSQEHLVAFLKKLNYLDDLHLNDVFLDETFCHASNQLGQLTALRLVGTRWIVSFDFVFNFKLLRSFLTDHDFKDIQDFPILTLFTRLQYLNETEFYIAQEYTSIDRKQNRYTLVQYTESNNKATLQRSFLEKEIDFDELVRWITAIFNKGNSSTEWPQPT